MQIAIVEFPGSNCERETSLAVRRAGMTPVAVLWNDKEEALNHCQGIILIGGFSYEDRGRAGVIAAHLPIMDAIVKQAQQGKPVLGICNGAQILVESGLIPGFPHSSAALTENKRVLNGQVVGTGFYNTWVHIKPSVMQAANAFTRCLKPQDRIYLPLAHAEGRFLLSQALQTAIQQGHVVGFQYCTAEGDCTDTFPVNPNGSTLNLAALCNPAGNVMAMMPHPERTPNGDSLFLSMRDYIANGFEGFDREAVKASIMPKPAIKPYPPQPHELVVALLITDNHAVSIEQSLRRQGIPVRIKRRIHWRIHCKDPILVEQIKTAGVLYNEKKEQLINARPGKTEGQRSFIVTPKEDLHGLQVQQTLARHFALDGDFTLQRSIIWQIQADPGQLDQAVEQVLASSMLFNPVSHECHRYD